MGAKSLLLPASFYKLDAEISNSLQAGDTDFEKNVSAADVQKF